MSESVEFWTWSDAPEWIKDFCVESGKLDGASRRQEPLIMVFPRNTAAFDHVPIPVLDRLNGTHNRVVTLSAVDKENRTARVWFDVVGITL